MLHFLSKIDLAIFPFFFIFARIAGALIIFPAIGNAFTPVRVRVALILIVSLILTPPLKNLIPAEPNSVGLLIMLLFKEFIIGLFLGLVAKLVITALDVAGMIIANQASLANASVFNPSLSSQASLPSTFLSMIGIVLIFVSNLHLLFFEALAESYHIFNPKRDLMLIDMVDLFIQHFSKMMLMGVKIAAPFLMVGLLFYLSLGLLARLMPQIQIFFIAIPVQILIGFTLLMFSLASAMLLWTTYFENQITFLTGGF